MLTIRDVWRVFLWALLLMWFLVVVCGAAHAAYTASPTCQTHANATSGGTTTPAVDCSSTGVVDLVVVTVATDSTTSAMTITDNSTGPTNTYTQVIAQGNAGLHKNYVFYTQAPNVTSSMTFTVGGTSLGHVYMWVQGFTGSIASPLENQFGVGSPTTTVTSVTVPASPATPAQANELVVTTVSTNVSTGSAPAVSGGTWTTVGSVLSVSGQYYGAGLAYQIQTAAASAQPTWTQTNTGSMGATMAFFKAAAGAAVACKRTLMGVGC